MLELLLVMALMAIMTAVMVPNLRGFNVSQRLTDSASQMQSDMRRVQNNAVSGLKCTTNTATNWYMELRRDAATNKIINYRIGATCLNGEVYSAVAYTLPPGINIGQIDLDACPVTDPAEMNQFRIYYSNIYGQTSFAHNVVSCGVGVNPQKVILNLKSDADASLINKVILNTGGAIYVQ